MSDSKNICFKKKKSKYSNKIVETQTAKDAFNIYI